jgi:tetratricopeptide (TPR) repeat protein
LDAIWSFIKDIWAFVLDDKNRAILGWFGGGIVTLAGGAWAVFTFLHKKEDKPKASGAASPVTVQGPVSGGGVASGIVTESQIYTGPVTQNISITHGLSEADKQFFAGLIKEYSLTSGLDEKPLRAILQKLNQAHVPVAEIPQKLDAAIEELLRLRADLSKLRNESPEFTALRAAALHQIDAGEFEKARTILQEARQRASMLREEASRTEAGFLIDEARIDRLQYNHAAALEKLTQASKLDPNNTWLWIEMGDLHSVLGSLPQALIAYRQAMDVAQKNGDQRDLSVSHDRIGDVQQAQGDLAAALASYQAGLSIRKRLAEADPSHAERQRDLSVSHNKIGLIEAALGHKEEALKRFNQGRAITQRLMSIAPGMAVLKSDLDFFDQQLATLR